MIQNLTGMRWDKVKFDGMTRKISKLETVLKKKHEKRNIAGDLELF